MGAGPRLMCRSTGEPPRRASSSAWRLGRGGGLAIRSHANLQPRRGSVVSDDELEAYPSSVGIFYDESKAARDAMDQLLIRYRTNTTAVLALATGAATFFGFSDSPKGLFFLLSIVSYAVAALFATAIYWPKPWRVNAAYNVADTLSKSPPRPPMKLRWDLALSHQQAIAESLKVVGGRTVLAPRWVSRVTPRWVCRAASSLTGQAMKFRVLVLATASVVIFAGVNSYLASQPPPRTPPTHIVIEPTHIDTDRIHITVDPSYIVMDPTHVGIGKAAR
jgi:hypothetical protein